MKLSKLAGEAVCAMYLLLVAIMHKLGCWFEDDVCVCLPCRLVLYAWLQLFWPLISCCAEVGHFLLQNSHGAPSHNLKLQCMIMSEPSP